MFRVVIAKTALRSAKQSPRARGAYLRPLRAVKGES
jgi:hypothetical protein